MENIAYSWCTVRYIIMDGISLVVKNIIRNRNVSLMDIVFLQTHRNAKEKGCGLVLIKLWKSWMNLWNKRKWWLKCLFHQLLRIKSEISETIIFAPKYQNDSLMHVFITTCPCLEKLTPYHVSTKRCAECLHWGRQIILLTLQNTDKCSKLKPLIKSSHTQHRSSL
jgi:hypothetical protein